MGGKRRRKKHERKKSLARKGSFLRKRSRKRTMLAQTSRGDTRRQKSENVRGEKKFFSREVEPTRVGVDRGGRAH